MLKYLVTKLQSYIIAFISIYILLYRNTYIPFVFYTIVMNGWPFINYHYSVFSSLNIYFQWHIIEGLAYGRADKTHPYSRKNPISVQNVYT